MAKGMRNAPQFDLSKVRASQPAENAPAAAPVVNELIRQAGGLKPGSSVSMPVCGREVVFTLKSVPAGQVERKTLVWGENERLQELLTEAALDDLIPSFVSGGQIIPAFGREVNGLVEVADGSRRRKTAIFTRSDYRVLVGNLDDEQMAALSQEGNNYRETSAYERGRRYSRLLESKYDGNVSALAAAEKKDRKIITRCVNTASLPIEVIKLFTNPSELSARAGDELYSVFRDHGDAMLARVSDFQMYRDCGETLETDFVVTTLKSAGTQKPEKEKPTVRKFAEGMTAKYREGAVDISLRGVAPEVIRRIEAILEAAGKPGSSADVDALFLEVENKLKEK